MSEFLQPSSLSEALRARQAHTDYQVIAGGTDLLVASKDRKAPVGTIDIFGLPELSSIDKKAEGGLRIGAGVTYAQLLDSEEISQEFPLLALAAREVGATQIQSRGTVGGNIATSSPVGDSLPAFLALGAQIEVANASGSRMVDYEKFLVGYRKVDLAPDELIVAIHLPALPGGTLQFWRKVGTRRAQSISKVMIAAVGHVSGGKVDHIQIALGAVADRTIRLHSAESSLVGQEIAKVSEEELRKIVSQSITPISDLRSEAEYRLKVAENLVCRFVNMLGADA